MLNQYAVDISRCQSASVFPTSSSSWWNAKPFCRNVRLHVRITDFSPKKKNFCPLSSSQNLIRASAGFSRNGQRLLCFHTDDRSPTQLTLPRATQIRPPRQTSQCKRFNSSSRDAVKCLVPTSAKLTDVSIFSIAPIVPSRRRSCKNR